MNDDQNTVQDNDATAAAEPGSSAPPAMPVLPDGIGLGYDEVAELLRKQSNVAISADDPIMMMLPVLNAFLTEEQKLMTRHQAALAKIMSDRTGGFVAAVENVAKEIGETLSSSAVESLGNALAGHNQGMEQHQALMEKLNATFARHLSEVRLWALIAAISAIVNVAVFVALFLLKR